VARSPACRISCELSSRLMRQTWDRQPPGGGHTDEPTKGNTLVSVKWLEISHALPHRGKYRTCHGQAIKFAMGRQCHQHDPLGRPAYRTRCRYALLQTQPNFSPFPTDADLLLPLRHALSDMGCVAV